MRSDRVTPICRVLACLLSPALAAAGAWADDLRTNAPARLPAAATADAEELLFHHGSAQYAAGQYAEAQKTLERFATEYPQSRRRTTALLGCGWSLVKLQRLSEARRFFEPLASDAAVGPQARRWLAWLDATQAERTTTSRTTWAPQSSSSDPAIRCLAETAWGELQAGRLSEAEAAFAQLLLAEPEPEVAAEAALTRGHILEQLQQADAALAMYDTVVTHYAQTRYHSEALWAAARLRDDLEQDQAALELYERLAAAFPKFAAMDALVYRQAWVLHDLGRPEVAQTLFQRLVREFPQSSYWAETAFHLAQQAFQAHRYAEADELAGRVLERATDEQTRGNACYLRGQIAAAQQHWPEARAAFAAVADHDPDPALRLQSEYGAAETLFRQGQYAEAAVAFEALVRQSQGSREPWMTVFPLRQAQALGHQQRWDEAYAVASQIPSESRTGEGRFEVDYLLGRCLAQRTEFQQAREAYQRVLRAPGAAQSETAAQAQLMLAESYFQQTDDAAALREFLRTEQDYAFPALQAAALLQAAKCQERQGQPAEALRLYGRLLERYPQSPLRGEAQTRLAQLQPSTSPPKPSETR